MLTYLCISRALQDGQAVDPHWKQENGQWIWQHDGADGEQQYPPIPGTGAGDHNHHHASYGGAPGSGQPFPPGFGGPPPKQQRQGMI